MSLQREVSPDEPLPTHLQLVSRVGTCMPYGHYQAIDTPQLTRAYAIHCYSFDLFHDRW